METEITSPKLLASFATAAVCTIGIFQRDIPDQAVPRTDRKCKGSIKVGKTTIAACFGAISGEKTVFYTWDDGQ